MAVVNRIAGEAERMAEWRQALHRRPELGFECHETAAFIAARLREMGVDALHPGLAQSGLVALVHGRAPGPVIGLRADIDALPITEATGAPYASVTEGRMHACGHDGHATMLLGAAQYLAETRNFAGTAALIFQPAEEQGGGAGVMVEEGVFERFGIARVFALHTAPGLPEGQFATATGPILAGEDTFFIEIDGVGGHAATPHETADPIVAALAVAQAIQTVVGHNIAPLEDVVVSLTQIHAGTTDNVIPAEAWLGGTVRSFETTVRDRVRARLEAIVAGQAAAFGVAAQLRWQAGYPPTVNHAAETALALETAAEIVGAENVDPDRPRAMGSEDFSYMLEACPGAYLHIGQGPGAGLHHPAFDFNDAILPVGASFFARLVERLQPL